MTDVASLGLMRPKLHPAVVLGPAQRRGPSVVHYIKQRETEWYYRIGAREHFLVSLMDGTRTVDEINDQHAEAYGQPLSERDLQTLLGMLSSRQLLDGWTDEERVRELRSEARERARRSPSPWRMRRFPLVDPERFLGPAARRLAFLFRPAWVTVGLVAAALVTAFILANIGQLWGEWRQAPSRWAALPFVLFATWVVVGMHEFAHGVVCTHFGGTVREIGVLWRIPMFAWYCKVDDVMLFPRRSQRVATAFAGVFVSMLAMIPFAVAYTALEPGTQARTVVAGVLVVGLFAGLVNLVPFFQLDGYFMLTHALGMADLRRESYRYWGRRLRAWRTGDREALAGYPRGDRVVYALYGGFTWLVLAGIVGGVFTIWFLTLRPWLGATVSATLLTAEAALFVVLGVWFWRRRKRRAQEEVAAGAAEATS